MEEESLSTSTAEDKEEPVKLELVVLEVAIIHAYHAHDTRITCFNTKLCSANQKLFRAYSQMPAILKNSKIMPGIISAPLVYILYSEGSYETVHSLQNMHLYPLTSSYCELAGWRDRTDACSSKCTLQCGGDITATWS